MGPTEQGWGATACGTVARPPLLLCVAPLSPAGGVDTLLTAFGLLAEDRPPLSLTVAGGGPWSRDLRDCAEDLGLAERVDFCGLLPRAAVRAAVRRSGVLVLPYRQHDDGPEHLVPGLLDAFAAGRPVVATAPVAAPLLVRHRETGLVVPPDDPTALATALAEVLDHPERAGALAAAGCSAAGALPAAGPSSPLRRLWRQLTT
ncbi:glycosyltransferase [Geodermatophilus sp. SYSU D00703]